MEVKKLKVFVSYSHNDESHVNEFKKHISPLVTKNIISVWYDREIIPGKKLLGTIDSNLENSDVILLFISASFLSSPACLIEQKRAFQLMKERGISVVPIILSKCSWLDDDQISSLLVLPTDGKAIKDFDGADDAWFNVYNGLKAIINAQIEIMNLEFSENHIGFLQSAEMLTKAHSKKEQLLLSDIFVYPELEKYDDVREYEKKENSENVVREFFKYSRVLIAGENQSGKTSLCKKIILRLKERNFIPVYISDKNGSYQGKIENKISAALKKQYQKIKLENIDKGKIVPILDDFHFAKRKEKIIQDLSTYQFQVMIVDDIFSLNLRNDNLIQSYSHFKIKELSPTLRNSLIQKWTYIADTSDSHNDNSDYQVIDKTTELVNVSLGKIIGSGIMPAYPFFILSVITTNETFGSTLDQEITSQGYCYQALIYLYLTKENVKSEDIDTYINFLNEFAFFFYEKGQSSLPKDEFEEFMQVYLKKYNMPVKEDILIAKLLKTQIIKLDCCNNYSFYYPYLYYFFVAKHLSEHIGTNNEVIDCILDNLHKDQNAYIAIFVSHHSKNTYILDKLSKNAEKLFERHKVANLTKDEVGFFDSKLDVIVKEALPSTNSTPEKERAERLEAQDDMEHISDHEEKSSQEEDDELGIELRRSIKTVEVMGRIIKNRAGSLEKERLESIFEEGIKVHLRILSSFFEAIQNEEDQFVEYISERLNKVISDKKQQRKLEGKSASCPSTRELEKLARSFFWNMNFFVIYGLINKIVHSLGSDKLTNIVKNVCDNENTPASFLIKHGILMWYNKNLQIDNIISKIDNDGFSETAKKIIKFMVANHCALHTVDYKHKQRIQEKLGIPYQKLIKQST